METKGIFCKLSIFLTLFLITNQSSLRELISTKPEINCSEEPHLKHFHISTNYNEDSDSFDIPIVNECKVHNLWLSRENQYSQCIIKERVFEGEDNIRRVFRFTNSRAKDAEKIHIKDIRLYYDKLIADSSISLTNMVLSPGESRDIFLDYECIDKDETKSLSVPWYNLKIQVEFENGRVVNFEMIKICTASYTNKLDFSHLLIIVVGILIIYFSAQDYLKSEVEVVLLKKFHEMRNPENLTLMTLIISLLFIFLGVVGGFPTFSYYMSIIIGILSLALVIQTACHKGGVLTNLDSVSYEIPYVGSISLLFLIGLGGGAFLVFLWTSTKNWFFSDLIAISIAFIIIRLFRLTCFKWIVGIYISVFVYDIFWMKNHSNSFGENYKLTNQSPIPLPVKIICPEMYSSPFSACSYISIADIVLPGLLLTYSKMFDILHNSNDIYFNAGVIGTAAGFIIDVIVYYSQSLPTPCFLYTGPLILAVSIAIAISRSELNEYINGFASNLFENRSLEKNNDFMKENLDKIATEYDTNNNDMYELKDFSLKDNDREDGDNQTKTEGKKKLKNPYDVID